MNIQNQMSDPNMIEASNLSMPSGAFQLMSGARKVGLNMKPSSRVGKVIYMLL